VTGNTSRISGQVGWAFLREEGDHFVFGDIKNLSGIVGHGFGFPPENLSAFGMPGKQVRLLDGLLISCRSETLLTHGLRFNERLLFHFYDLDFCRQAEVEGLKMGTWGLSIVHESPGNFMSEAWRQGRTAYLGKWGS